MCKKLSHNIEKLLEDTPESWYWVGFILADGHISERKRLTIRLANKDRNHLENFCKFINLNINTVKYYKKTNSVTLSVMDTKILTKLVDKFDISNNKTYNPPKLVNMNKKLMISLYIGFIDGDGCIRKQYKRHDCLISIKCHKTWEIFLRDLSDNLYRYFNLKELHGTKNSTYLGKYSNINICNNALLKRIKGYSLKYNLPVLNRKWDKIDLEFYSKYEKTKKMNNRIERLYKQGFRRSQIYRMLGISKSHVYTYFYRKNRRLSDET